MINAERIHRWSCAILISLLLAIGVVFLASNGIKTPNGGRLGGDFPAFYGAATLVSQGRGNNLYSLEAQREVQQETGALPNDEQGHLIYAYPPFVAAILTPLATLSFPSAYRVYTLLMLIGWFFALRLLAQVFPVVKENFMPALALSLAFYPMFRGVTGGQNSALGLLCFTGILHSIGDPKRMGSWLGAWLFKAQYAILFIPTLLGIGAYKAFISLALWALAYYGLATYVSGSDWIAVWLHDGVMPFFQRDVVANLHHFTTLRGIILRLTNDASTAALIGTSVFSLFLVGTVFHAYRHRTSDKSLIHLLCLIGAIAPVVSLHGLFYDAALLVPALAAIASSRKSSDYWFVGAIVLLSWSDLLSPTLPFQPTTALILVVTARLLLRFPLEE